MRAGGPSDLAGPVRQRIFDGVNPSSFAVKIYIAPAETLGIPNPIELKIIKNELVNCLNRLLRC